ncbi:MAG TPA: hypothetical protein VMW08_02025 [Acidimicrobiales bacterium]|nr:hypothetical protein [Acidimicrobiales bacterium]
MDAGAIRFVTFAVAVLVVVAYAMFVIWRVRVHRRRREAEGEKRAGTETLSSAATLRPSTPDAIAPASTPATPSEPPVRPTSGTQRPATVLEAVAGIALPHDLVPHPDVTPRLGALDRVALAGSMISLEDLQSGLEDSLGALGYTITWADWEGLARRGEAELRVDVYTAPRAAHIEGVPAFPLAAEGAVIVDFWIPKAD